MSFKSQIDYTITAGSGAVITNIDLLNADNIAIHADNNAVTLTSNFIYDATGNIKDGVSYDIEYDGFVTTGPYSVTIFGQTLTSAQALLPQTIKVRRISGSWVSKPLVADTGVPNMEGTNILPESLTGDQIAADTITPAKLKSLTDEGYLYRAGASGVVEEFDAKAAGNVVMGTGTGVASQAITGDINIDGSGNATIPAGTISESQLGFTIGAETTIRRQLTSAEILALGTSPIIVIPAPGVGKYIEVTSASMYITYATTPYATITSLNLITVGSSLRQMWFPSILGKSISTGQRALEEPGAVGAANAELIENAAVQLITSTGVDPTAGDSIATLSITYKTVEI